MGKFIESLSLKQLNYYAKRGDFYIDQKTLRIHNKGTEDSYFSFEMYQLEPDNRTKRARTMTEFHDYYVTNCDLDLMDFARFILTPKSYEQWLTNLAHQNEYIVRLTYRPEYNENKTYREFYAKYAPDVELE